MNDAPPESFSNSLNDAGISDSRVAKIKVPPHSIEAEHAVLGGLMLAPESPESWEAVSETLVAEDFYRANHQLIYRAMAELVRDNQPIDIITLSEALQSKAELEQAGGLPYLTDLASNTSSVANIGAYAKIIRERAMLRQLITAASTIADASYFPGGKEAQTILADAESELARIQEGRLKTKGPQPINPLLKKATDKLDELFESGGAITGLSTGYKDLDKMTSGLQRSDLIIVAGRPAMGKTAFAMNLVETAVMQQNDPVVVFSMEMPANQLITRMLSSLGKINQTRLRNGQLQPEDWLKLTAAAGKLKDRPLFIDDTSALSPVEVRNRVKRIQREHGKLALVAIDYLQLMRVPGMQHNRVEEISEISRSLKAMAKDFDCPVVALSQLNRGLEQRKGQNKRPLNSDLRESGAIEQDADVIAFIYRDEVYNEDTDKKGIAEIILGKQRNGPIGTCELVFIAEFTRFENRAHDAQF